MGLEKMFAKPSGNTMSGASPKSRKMSALTASREEPPSSPPIFNVTRENTMAEVLLSNNELESVKEVHEQRVEDQENNVLETEPEPMQSHFKELPGSEQDTKISSQSGESSGFSPVFISKHHDAAGSVKYAALDISKTELEEQLQRHRESLQQSLQHSQQQQQPPVIEQREGLSSDPSDALPDDLPTGTPDVLPLGDFVNVRRGGFSAEGSFRRRPLSPSPLVRPPTVNVVNSQTQHSIISMNEDDATIEPTDNEIRPPAPTPPASRTPNHIRGAKSVGQSAEESLLSPLKLFGDHDTYTSNRLQRRMSQLELQDPSIQEIQEEPPEEADELSSVNDEEHGQTQREARQPSQGSRFGSGQLDSYPFPEVSILSAPASESDTGQVRSRSPSPNQMPPGAKDPLKFRVGSGSSAVYDTFKHKRKTSKLSNRSGSLTVSKRSANNTQKGPLPQQLPKLMVETESVSFVSEGKRPLTPFYDPTPKRRRTLVFAEEDEEIPARSIISTQDSHERMQSIVGRKRKDARHSNISNQADADTLSKRHILRPRNPTPSQRRQEQIEQEILETTKGFMASPPRMQSIREHLRPPIINPDDEDPESSRLMAEEEQARAVAEQVAAYSVRVTGGMKHEGRKRSVTTQDFLDEAMKIMDFIRTKRPTSALESLEESDEDRLNEEEEQQDEVTELPSSPQAQQNGWRQRDIARLDSSVANHLRQFEDNDDPFVASSWSIHQGHANEPLTPVNEDQPESDPPGLRIVENPEVQNRHANQKPKDGAGEYSSKGSSMPSHKSHPSVDSSLGRTTMTSTSRKSEKVATIAPSNVAHLIGKEVNGMHFDQQKQTWVRSKSLSPTKEVIERDVSGVTGSEEDPFGEIPDLTVDEEVEMERVSASPSRPITATSAQWMEREFRISQADQKLEALRRPNEPAEAHPPLDDIDAGTKTDSSSTTQKRAAGIANSPTLKKNLYGTTSKKAPNGPRPQFGPPRATDTVDHEYSINEGRDSPPRAQKHRQVSQIQISISSPAVPSQIQESDSMRRKPSTAYKTRELPPLPSHRNTAQRLAKQALEPVNEHHEVSIIDYGANNRRVNFSVSVSAPLAVVQTADQEVVVAPSSPMRVDTTYATFLMSELDDFTINQPDEIDQPSREITKVSSGKLVCIGESRFENGNAALVKALQDVEPQEPFWEELRTIDLPHRDLTSLHLLDVLCDQAESMNVSDNALAQLVGAPSSIRDLNVSNNLLTGLTSWTHLTNLQYLDVSGNDIDNCRAFSSLVHLRELRADDNRVDSLEGLMELDGLLGLSLKRNSIKSANFDRCRLSRLEKLYLEGNQLGEGDGVQGLHSLPSLQELSLDHNELAAFEDTDSDGYCIEKVSLRGNRITELAMSFATWPALRHLNVDDNRLSSFAGISMLCLHTLSAQRQQPPLGQDFGSQLFQTLPQTRSIVLSGTHLPTFTLPSTGLPHLTRLELASCGLQRLPADFGSLVPSLTHLNLNFNNLSDIAPLLGCKSLETLLAANNRIGRLRKVIAVLERIGRGIKTLDLRGSPVVNGFYDSQSTDIVRRNTQEAGMELARNFGATNRLENPSVRRPGHRPRSEDFEDSHYPVSCQNAEADAIYRSRLDDDTAMRRRVYEIMLLNALMKIQQLDSLEFRRKDVQRRDEVWLRLERLGIIKPRQEN